LLVRLSILFLPDFLRIVFYKLYPELIIWSALFKKS
jgi:hypothetical protein